MDFYTACERLGIPVTLLVIIAVALWKVITWLGTEVVKPIAESHIALVETTKAAQITNTATLEKVSSILEAKGGTLLKIEQQNDQILVLANKNHDLLQSVKNKPEA